MVMKTNLPQSGPKKPLVSKFIAPCIARRAHLAASRNGFLAVTCMVYDPPENHRLEPEKSPLLKKNIIFETFIFGFQPLVFGGVFIDMDGVNIASRLDLTFISLVVLVHLHRMVRCLHRTTSGLFARVSRRNTSNFINVGQPCKE